MNVSLVIDVLQSKYPLAQSAFLEFEVFEQAQARDSIKKFTKVFELLANAAIKNDPILAQEAANLLDSMAYQNLAYLCDGRLKQINWLHCRGWLFWLAMFRSNPFQKEEIKKTFIEGLQKYKRAQSPDISLSEKAATLQDCLYHLEQVITILQPDCVYNSIFNWLLTILLAIASGITSVYLF